MGDRHQLPESTAAPECQPLSVERLATAGIFSSRVAAPGSLAQPDPGGPRRSGGPAGPALAAALLQWSRETGSGGLLNAETGGAGLVAQFPG